MYILMQKEHIIINNEKVFLAFISNFLMCASIVLILIFFVPILLLKNKTVYLNTKMNNKLARNGSTCAFEFYK